MDPVKIAGVWEWPTLENKTDVQAFLGFVSFYQRFIRDFSTTARLLFDLTCSEQVWTWSGREQAAFEDLKTAVTTALVLMFPQDSDPFWIEADSSDFAIRAVLSQQSTTDGKWHPITFYSKSLSSMEWNYEIHDKEMLAIIRVLMGINRFDHETKVKARSERQNLQTALQLCTKQVGTGEINQIIESLLKVKVQRITKTY